MKSHLIALFTVGIWGVTFVSTKVLLEDFSPLWILLLRFTIGFIALFALRPKILKMKRRRDELLFIAAGATGIAGYYLLENIALVFTTATAVGVIVAASQIGYAPEILHRLCSCHDWSCSGELQQFYGRHANP